MHVSEATNSAVWALLPSTCPSGCTCKDTAVTGLILLILIASSTITGAVAAIDPIPFFISVKLLSMPILSQPPVRPPPPRRQLPQLAFHRDSARWALSQCYLTGICLEMFQENIHGSDVGTNKCHFFVRITCSHTEWMCSFDLELFSFQIPTVTTTRETLKIRKRYCS